jgi:two-component system OmpR family response regulator
MTGSRLLLIDGDSKRAAALVEQLQLLGYSVELATDGKSGHERALEGQFDLIILDLRVGGRDGQLICQSLRAHQNSTPLLALTCEFTEDGAQATLLAGADAVIAMPCRPTLLGAWVHTLLRRQRWFEATYFKSAHVIRVGDLAINIERRTVTRGGKPIEFTELEFSILLALARSAGNVVPRASLLTEVWGDRANDVYDEAVNAQIKRIRRKLEPNPADPQYIRTSYRNGYLLSKPEAPRADKQRGETHGRSSRPKAQNPSLVSGSPRL